jgi:hypothetical protein
VELFPRLHYIFLLDVATHAKLNHGEKPIVANPNVILNALAKALDINHWLVVADGCFKDFAVKIAHHGWMAAGDACFRLQAPTCDINSWLWERFGFRFWFPRVGLQPQEVRVRHNFHESPSGYIPKYGLAMSL